MHVDFAATSYPVRLFSGHGALDALPRELGRLGCSRAFLVCGRSVSRSTPLVARIRALAGERCAGLYDEAGRNATLRSVSGGVAAAREAGADCIVAIGAGSVMVTGRLIAILLAESGAPDRLMTRYTEAGAPVSPRLDAPKLPIINVLTAATNAQSRGGAAMLDELGGRRMEFFDPKTRPCAIFWDCDAVMTAPDRLARNAALTVYWWSLMWMGSAGSANPLVQGDRSQAFRLASDALRRLHDPEQRVALCAAAYLQNRDEDMGGRPYVAHWISRVCYALGAGVLSASSAADVGDVYAALTIPACHQFAGRCAGELAAMARALGVADESVDGFAQAFDGVLAHLGGRKRLRDMLPDESALPRIRHGALRSYNADPRGELRHEAARLDTVLEQAW